MTKFEDACLEGGYIAVSLVGSWYRKTHSTNQSEASDSKCSILDYIYISHHTLTCAQLTDPGSETSITLSGKAPPIATSDLTCLQDSSYRSTVELQVGA